MRQAIGFLLVLAIGIGSAAQQPETEKEKTADYYPLKPGTKWIYEVEANGQKIKLTIRSRRWKQSTGSRSRWSRHSSLEMSRRPST